jgi:hypothetical protein
LVVPIVPFPPLTYPDSKSASVLAENHHRSVAYRGDFLLKLPMFENWHHSVLGLAAGRTASKAHRNSYFPFRLALLLGIGLLVLPVGDVSAQRQENQDQSLQVGSGKHAEFNEGFFADSVYPMLRAGLCQECHNDNGVASDTLLEFPGEQATRQQIEAFGLELMELVDRQQPRESLLLLKPTDREDHTGGEKIQPGSAEEELLLKWIEKLASMSEADIAEARERIAAAKQTQLSSLAVRRLTHSQYNNTVRDLLRDQTRPASRFPQEDFIRGFKNQAEGQGISPLQAEAYSKAAERLAVAAFRGGDHQQLIPREPKTFDDAVAAEAFVRDFGLRAFRRPLLQSEVEAYTRLFIDDAVVAKDFLAGAKIVVEAMLQSPHFLFKVERGPGSEFEQYERASRLSYFLWDTMPSSEMLQAAAAGEFSTRQQIASWARQLLNDPQAKTSLEEFLSQWLRFDRVLGATRDRQFRQFNSEVAAEMVEETTRLFNHVVWEDRDFFEFYTADYTFLSSSLAEIYGMPAPEAEFAKVEYPTESGRGGVLGHGSFLVATSKPSETSPTERGLFVRSQFLTHEVPAPPPGVTTSLPEITEEKPMTNRERLAIHLNSDACSGCHRLIDPIGLGLEQYDAIGAFHQQMEIRVGGRRDGKTIELDLDTQAHIQGIANSEFTSPKELGEVLARSEASQRAVVKQLFRYAFGREETADDEPYIEQMLEEFRASGFRFRELIIALVTSHLFMQEAETS